MKTLTLGLLSTLVAFSGTAAATNYDSTNGYVGATDQNPTNWTPTELASRAHQMTYSEREKTFTDNGVWYQWNEPSYKNYDFMIFTFADVSPSTATMNWEVAIDEDDNGTHLLYWHGVNGNWVWLADNDPPGGRYPGKFQTNVKSAYDNNQGDTVIFIFVGYTPAAGDDWIKCDVCDVDAN